MSASVEELIREARMVGGGITDKHVLESLLLGGSGNKGWGSRHRAGIVPQTPTCDGRQIPRTPPVSIQSIRNL